MASQKRWQQNKRALGLCRICGQPPRLRQDGTPAALCQSCYDKQQDYKRRRRYSAGMRELASAESWRCPDHPTARTRPSDYIPGQYMCTMRYPQRNDAGQQEYRFCQRKSTDMPLMTQRDSYRCRHGGRLAWESEPPPAAYVVAESEYMRWYYRQNGRLPWEPEPAESESDGRIKRILRRITGGGDA